MPASMPTRHGGRFTNRAAIRAREIFSRRTIAPLSSRPIICSVFLPVSIPMVRATAVSALLGMACPLRALQKPPTDSACRWGREHGRSIPFAVEQGYGVCGARDERALAGQQQQLVDQLGHDVLPRNGAV